jgi:hypothetical protein
LCSKFAEDPTIARLVWCGYSPKRRNDAFGITTRTTIECDDTDLFSINSKSRYATGIGQPRHFVEVFDIYRCAVGVLCIDQRIWLRSVKE